MAYGVLAYGSSAYSVRAYGAATDDLVNGMAGGTIGAVIPSQATFTVTDLHPVRGKTFRALVNADISRARKLGLHPLLELGGSGCGVCHALRKHLDARPRSPQVRAAFAGTGIIRVDIEEWPDVLAALGLGPDERIPMYVALDTTGRVTRRLHVDYWTLRSLDTDTLNTIRRFFRSNQSGARQLGAQSIRKH